jgi:hypothetical protein
MINFESSVGLSNNKSGFDSLVEAATVASQKFKIGDSFTIIFFFFWIFCLKISVV